MTDHLLILLTLGSRRSRYDSDSGSESPPRNRRKSLGEQALAALGIGGAAAAAHGGNKDRARSRGRGGDYSRSPSPANDRNQKIQQAVKAAVTAGAIEAFRSRKEPGGWQGQGKRVLTAAIGAAGINGAIDKDPNHHSTRHTIEAALGGLAGNRLINGARSRSRSRGRHGEKENGVGAGGLAATAGLAALGVKALNDYRNKSKDQSRRYSSESDGSRSPGPRRKRSNSVSAFITRGLDRGKAALGIEPEKRDDSSRRDSRQSRGGYDDRVSRRGGDDQYQARPRGGGADDDSTEKPKHDTSTDYSSEEEIKKQKKMHAKELITAGLATVATIHAAHSVYQTREKREKRKKQVEEGKISPEEAKKLEKKGLLQDAASVGIAALGIKGAYSEWKEMKEQREEYHQSCHELEEKRQRRREKQMREQMKGQNGGSGGGSQGGYRNSEPNLNQRYVDAYGPRYYDGNPYSAGLPPPPMGAPPMRY